MQIKAVDRWYNAKGEQIVARMDRQDNAPMHIIPVNKDKQMCIRSTIGGEDCFVHGITNDGYLSGWHIGNALDAQKLSDAMLAKFEEKYPSDKILDMKSCVVIGTFALPDICGNMQKYESVQVITDEDVLRDFPVSIPILDAIGYEEYIEEFDTMYHILKVIGNMGDEYCMCAERYYTSELRATWINEMIRNIRDTIDWDNAVKNGIEERWKNCCEMSKVDIEK